MYLQRLPLIWGPLFFYLIFNSKVFNIAILKSNNMKYYESITLEQYTQLEVSNRLVFDWNEFLNKGPMETYSSSELQEAEASASSWVTCACGNQCSIIPRNWRGEPFDGLLTQLGMQFYKNIEDMVKAYRMGDVEEFEIIQKIAKNTLIGIERRSIFLINQINKENGNN